MSDSKYLYVVIGEFLLDEKSGVGSKIKAKIVELRKLNVNIESFSISLNIKIPLLIDDYNTIVPASNIGDAYKIIDQKIASENYKCVLFRYPFGCEKLNELVIKHKNKIVFEHNTFEEIEALLLQKRHFKKLSFSLSLSYFKYWFNTFVLKNTEEYTYGKKIFENALCGIAVTNEIAKYEESRCRGYKNYVISNGAEEVLFSNGINVKFIDTLKAVMLIGHDAEWHGVDRIIKGLQAFKNEKIKIVVDIFGGEEIKFDIDGLSPNCEIRFFKNTINSDLNKLLLGYHIAFSTLALHRKKMIEASSLKLRHSMLLGLPIVLAYKDTDVSENELFKNFIFQVPANDTPLNFDAIIDFYKTVCNIEDFNSKIRKLANNTFSYKVKAMQIKEILEKVA